MDERTGLSGRRTNGDESAAGRRSGLARLGCLGWWTVLVGGLAALDVVWIATQAPPNPRCFEWCDLGPTVGRAFLWLLAGLWAIGLVLGMVAGAIWRRWRH